MIEDILRRIIREELELALAPIRDGLGSRPPKAAPELLTTSEAARLARVTPETVRTWISAGRLAEHRSGRRLLIRRPDLIDLLRTTGKDPVAGAVEAELRLLKLHE